MCTGVSVGLCADAHACPRMCATLCGSYGGSEPLPSEAQLALMQDGVGQAPGHLADMAVMTAFMGPDASQEPEPFRNR